MSPLLANVLGEKLHADIKIKSVSWSWSGLAVLQDVEIHVKGIAGPASRVALLDTTTVEVTNWLPWQTLQIHKVTTNNVTLRIAESELIAGEFNFTSFMAHKLMAPSLTQTSKPDVKTIKDVITAIDLDELSVEIGTMGKSSWELSDTVNFEVSLEPLSEHAYNLVLENAAKNIRVQGSLNVSKPELELTLNPRQLDESLFSLLPKTARLWCSAIGLKGDVGELGVFWNTKTGLQLGVDVASLEFYLPEAHSLQWVHYENGIISKMQGDPSLRVDGGRILFDGTSATLENLRGVLLPPQSSKGSSEVPFQVTLKIQEIPSLQNLNSKDWFEAMKSSSPFTAKFIIDNFKSKFEGAGQVDLPIAVARILQLFHLKDWDANGQLIVQRTEWDGDIEYKGNIAVHGGAGWYEGFPYPLHEVNALIDVHNDLLVIQSLEASGSEGAAVSILGDITFAQETEVDLTLVVKDAPLDEALHDAVPKPVATVMERLLDQAALDALIAKGLVEESEFSLGGQVDMVLSIQHSGKEGDAVHVTGDLVFENTNIIHDAFPMPVIVPHASLKLNKTNLEIPGDEFVEFKTLSGGKGGVSGVIGFDHIGNTSPGITFSLAGEMIGDLIIEAVASSVSGSYHIIDGILGGLSIEGLLEVSGGVITSEDGNVDKIFNLTVYDGKAAPTSKLAKSIHASDSFWPEGFTLTDLNATVVVDNEGVNVKEVRATYDQGGLSASMKIQGSDYELQLQGTNWPISDKLVYLLPENASSSLSKSWQFLEPTGQLDAKVHMNHKDGKSSLYLEAVPVILKVSGAGETVSMYREQGEIIVDNSGVFLNDLTFSLKQENVDQGTVKFDGSIQVVEETSEYDITGRWDDAVASSPLSRAITGIIGSEAAVGYYDDISPDGRGLLTLETVKNDKDHFYKVVVVPENLTATFNERIAYAQFTTEGDHGQNQIIFDNTGIQFDNLGGKLGEGEFSLEGKINTTDSVHGTFQLDWDGPAEDESLFAVLPSVVGDTLVAMEISEGSSQVQHGEVVLVGPSWGALEVDFKGEIQLHGVSMNAGIPLTNIYGITKVEGFYDEEALSVLQLHLQLDKMTAVGREISNINGGLVLDPILNRMAFDGVRGNSSSGVVTITGWVGIEDSQEYEVTALLAGVMIGDEAFDEKAKFSGELTGWLAVEGVRGDSSSRRGIGRMQVSDGLFVKIPLSLRAMQLLQLTLPTTDAITTVSIELTIQGEDVTLNQIKLTGDDTSVQGLVINGNGTIEIPSFELDVELHPRAGWPILRDITGALGDQLFSIEVTGQLFNPTISYVPLPILSDE